MKQRMQAAQLQSRLLTLGAPGASGPAHILIDILQFLLALKPQCSSHCVGVMRRDAGGSFLHPSQQHLTCGRDKAKNIIRGPLRTRATPFLIPLTPLCYYLFPYTSIALEL